MKKTLKTLVVCGGLMLLTNVVIAEQPITVDHVVIGCSCTSSPCNTAYTANGETTCTGPQGTCGTNGVCVSSE